MTIVIMRTSYDTRSQLFLALFQGFQFLGNLPITLISHEALTGTREQLGEHSAGTSIFACRNRPHTRITDIAHITTPSENHSSDS